jgi:enamine deaminase RidA (YjgF/YER057c/UK114 family)
VGWNAIQQITDPADLGVQTRQALENIEVAVAAAGGSRTDIVSLRLYIVGDQIHNAVSVREALLGFFPAEHLPDQHLDRCIRSSQQRFPDRD